MPGKKKHRLENQIEATTSEAIKHIVIEALKTGDILLNMHDIAYLCNVTYQGVVNHYRKWKKWHDGQAEEPYNPLIPDTYHGASPMFKLETVIKWRQTVVMGRPSRYAKRKLQELHDTDE